MRLHAPDVWSAPKVGEDGFEQNIFGFYVAVLFHHVQVADQASALFADVIRISDDARTAHENESVQRMLLKEEPDQFGGRREIPIEVVFPGGSFLVKKRTEILGRKAPQFHDGTGVPLRERAHK